jgi:hypothetical protein
MPKKTKQREAAPAAPAATQQAQAPQPPVPSLVIVLLDQRTNSFKVLTNQTLKLQALGPGKTGLGYVEPRQRKSPDGTPLLKDGKPELEMAFQSFMEFPVDVVLPKKIELAGSVPETLKASSKVSLQ